MAMIKIANHACPEVIFITTSTPYCRLRTHIKPAQTGVSLFYSQAAISSLSTLLSEVAVIYTRFYFYIFIDENAAHKLFNRSFGKTPVGSS